MSVSVPHDDALAALRRRGASWQWIWLVLPGVFLVGVQGSALLTDLRDGGETQDVVLHGLSLVVWVVLPALVARDALRRRRLARVTSGRTEIEVLPELDTRYHRVRVVGDGSVWDLPWGSVHLPVGQHLWVTPLAARAPSSTSCRAVAHPR